MDLTTTLATLFNTILPAIPAQWAAAVSIIGSFIVATCALVSYFWKRPANGSKWLPLYALVNAVALNGKHAANADDTAAKK